MIYKEIYKFYLHNRKLREIFKSMDVNDSGTVKLGEVCTFYHMKYVEKFIEVNTIFLFLGLGDVAVEHNVQQFVSLGSAQHSK